VHDSQKPSVFAHVVRTGLGNMMSSSEFLIPTWRMRAKFLVSLILFAVWGLSHQYWLTPISDSLRCGDPCGRLLELRAAAAYLTLLPLPLALWFSWTAHRIHISGQIPPPSAWRLYRTRIHRGRLARAAVYIYAALGIIAAISIGVIAYTLELSNVFCITAPCGCK